MKAGHNSVGNFRVGIWIRVSTEDQARGDSPENHLKRAEAYATSRDWQICETYDLAGVSGRSVKEHPEAQRMLRDVKRGHIKGLIFSKLARFARNTKELLEFAEFFKAHDAALISLSESIDTTTPIGLLFYTMIAAMAQWEREEISDRLKGSLPFRAKNGKPMGGMSPYGYMWKDKRLVINPDEAPIRRLAFDYFLETKRKGTVAKKLNDAGYRTRAGAMWSDMAISRMLQNETAKGLFISNRTMATGPWKSEIKPESEWGITHVEPIVSLEVWEEVNRILEGQLKRQTRPAKCPVHPFAGRIRCVCDAPMYVRSNTRKYCCRKCRTQIAIIDVEEIFVAHLREYFTDAERIAGYLREAHEAVKGHESLISRNQNEIEKLKAEMDRTYRLYQSDALSVDGFKQIYQPLEQRVNELKAEQVRLQAEIDVKSAKNLSAEMVAEEARQLGQKWTGIDAWEKRKVVENIVEKIIVDRDRQQVEVTLHCMPHIPHEVIDIGGDQMAPPFCPDAPTPSQASLRESSKELTNSQQNL